jgi:CRISP-associated protein Cas1
MRDLSHVALFGNIQISTQAVQTLCERDVPVTYFSMGGWFYGITRGHGLKNIFLRIEQFRLARDSSVALVLARQFVHGKIRNQRTLLMRNHVEAPQTVLLKLKRAAEDALGAGSIESLLGIEGAAAALYFSEFNGMIKLDSDDTANASDGTTTPPKPFTLEFAHRNRRPPTDPVNAMLSLSYSLLTKDCTLAALAVGFDPYLGFYHQPRFGRPALALDLVEEFRPLIADDKRLRRVFKTCRNFGDHLQFSIFECDLNPSERIELERQLKDVIHHDEDQVLFVALGPAESRGDCVITSIGLPYSRLDAPCYVV